MGKSTWNLKELPFLWCSRQLKRIKLTKVEFKQLFWHNKGKPCLEMGCSFSSQRGWYICLKFLQVLRQQPTYFDRASTKTQQNLKSSCFFLLKFLLKLPKWRLTLDSIHLYKSKVDHSKSVTDSVQCEKV